MNPLYETMATSVFERMSLAAANVFGTQMVNAMQTREVSLSSLDNALKGVVCMAHDNVLVGNSGARAAVMGMMPNSTDTDSEVREFVQTLLNHNRIDMGKKTGAAARTAAPARASRATHAIHNIEGKKVLVRVCFQCGLHHA